jgi:hypothetical protein
MSDDAWMQLPDVVRFAVGSALIGAVPIAVLVLVWPRFRHALGERLRTPGVERFEFIVRGYVFLVVLGLTMFTAAFLIAFTFHL